MIDQVDNELQQWVQAVIGNVSVSLSRPDNLPPTSQPTINLYLLELAESPPLRSSQRPPLQIFLRYLISSWADDPLLAHRLLGQLVFAALQREEGQVDLTPFPAKTWAAFGLAPRPAFILSLPLRLERREAIAPLVRQPLVINGFPLASLEGMILGPEDNPLVGARVEMPALQRSTYTDSRGKFQLTGLPAGQPAQLQVKAKGRTLDLTVNTTPAGDTPLIIRFDWP